MPSRFPALPAAAPRPALAAWLFTVAGMIWMMVVLGGATRLTGSGLSIMEWAPLSGALPPLSHAEWERLFALYKTIPQYQLVNQGFGLAGFQHIFWLEWTHRLWGRLLGVVFLVPLVWFAVRRQIPRTLLPRLVLLFVLGGLQGAVGWFMVASGFEADRTSVSPYRLVVHLALALLLFAAILWTALGLRRPVPEPLPQARGVRRWVHAGLGLAALTILAGGLVAGTHAGLDYNTFPLMEGHLVPQGYAALSPFPRNLVANIAAVQFDHRLLATLTGLAAIGVAWSGLAAILPGATRRAVLAFPAAVALQYALGVATLVHVVPPTLATLHQAVAVMVLATGLVALHALRGARRAAIAGSAAMTESAAAAPMAAPMAAHRAEPSPG